MLNKASGLLTAKRVFLYAFALSVVTCFVFVKLSVQSERIGRNPGGDFVQFYSAAILARISPDKIYDSESQIRIQKQFSALQGVYWPYLHAPFFTVLLVPLSFLSYAEAYWFWTGLTLLLYLLSVIVLCNCCSPPQPPLSLAVAIACAAPVLYWLMITGQTTAIALFLWTFGFYLFKRSRTFWSTFILGFLSYRAQYLMALLPLLLIGRMGFAIFGVGMSFLLLFAVGGLAFSFHSYVEYVNSVADFSHRILSQAQPLTHYITLYGFFRRLLPNFWAMIATLVASALVVYWLAKTWRRTVPVQSGAFDLQYAMVVTTTLLLMHHGFVYDLILLTIPALLIYPHRSFFPPYYKILLALIYFIPYILLFFGDWLYFNPIQPLLIWLCFEIYRAYTKLDQSDATN